MVLFWALLKERNQSVMVIPQSHPSGPAEMMHSSCQEGTQWSELQDRVSLGRGSKIASQCQVATLAGYQPVLWGEVTACGEGRWYRGNITGTMR